MKRALQIYLIFLLTNNISAQQLPPDLLWSNTYTGGYGEICYAVRQTSDGGYILAGEIIYNNGDFWIVKTDENGDSLWCRQFGGPDDADDDYCLSVQQTADGGYLLAGHTESFGAGNADAWLIKTDENGDSLWSRTYGGTGEDKFTAIQSTSDGGYIFVGATSSLGAGDYDFWIVKTDENGNSLWSRTFGGSQNDYCRSVLQTSDGGYILAGSTESFGAGDYDLWIIRTDENGHSLWNRTFGGIEDERSTSVLQTSDEGFIIAASTESFGNGNEDFWIIKTDENGDSLWANTVGGSANERCAAVFETPESKYILAGTTESTGLDEDFWLVKVDFDGDSLWSQTFGTINRENCYAMQQTSDNGIIMAGDFRIQPWGLNHFHLIKTGPETIGITLDLQPYNTPILIPAAGGSFQFDFEILNYDSSSAYTLDAWIVATLPDGWPFPITSRLNLNLPAGGSLIRENLTQFIPGTALPGIFSYNGYVCDHYTWEVYADDSFSFEKLSNDGSSANDYDWDLYGWDIEKAPPVNALQEFCLTSVFPNPFNPTTVFSYQLQDASLVNLSIYDISGRLVAELANGWRDMGVHEMIWDASGVASGIYLYKLQMSGAGTSTMFTGKMVLMK